MIALRLTPIPTHGLLKVAFYLLAQHAHTRHLDSTDFSQQGEP
jgi:hypothetical protein